MRQETLHLPVSWTVTVESPVTLVSKDYLDVQVTVVPLEIVDWMDVMACLGFQDQRELKATMDYQVISNVICKGFNMFHS